MVKILLKTAAPVSEEEKGRNVEYAKFLGFPKFGKAGKPRVAIVGGGCSIEDHVDEIRNFDGDIWAINGAFHWCRDRGIDAWFFSVDQSECIADFCRGADRAMITMDCHPKVFDELVDANVEAIELSDLAYGPSTSTTAPAICLRRGYKEMVFYGCEGSFSRTTHAYGDYGLEMLLRVECGGEIFLTSADMLVQVEYLGDIIRQVDTCKERSGGLLAAYIRDPNVDVLAGSKSFHERISA